VHEKHRDRTQDDHGLETFEECDDECGEHGRRERLVDVSIVGTSSTPHSEGPMGLASTRAAEDVATRVQPHSETTRQSRCQILLFTSECHQIVRAELYLRDRRGVEVRDLHLDVIGRDGRRMRFTTVG
jgi:hypothetical protein